MQRKTPGKKNRASAQNRTVVINSIANMLNEQYKISRKEINEDYTLFVHKHKKEPNADELRQFIEARGMSKYLSAKGQKSEMPKPVPRMSGK